MALMNYKREALLLLLVAAAAAVGGGVESARFAVGGAAGWTLPSIGNVNYSDWATSQTFVVGDTLYFNYSKEYHNVMVVSKADYVACDSSNAISTFDDGATMIELNRSGTFYFLCGVPSHCTDGQKVAIKVRRHALSSSSSSSTASPQQSNDNIIIPSPSAGPSPSPSLAPKSVDSSGSALFISISLILTSMTFTISFCK